MASIVRRNSMWYIADRINGQCRRWSTGCLYDDEIGAQIKLREYQESLQKTGCRPKQTVKRTLEEHVDSFFQYQLAQQLTTKQASGNRMRITRLCQLARVDSVGGLTETRIQTALAKLRCQPQSPKVKPDKMPLVSARTRNTYQKSLQTFLNWMVRNNDIPRNPLDSMRCENEAVDVRHRRTAFTDVEFLQLYNAAQSSNRIIEGVDGPTRALAYLLSAYTGLRKSEVASLTAASFHFEEGQAYLIVEAACSKRRRRDTLPLVAHMIAPLQEALARVAPDGYLFPRLRQRKTHEMIKNDLAVAGLGYQTPDGAYRDWHALRHTFITRAWRTGAAPHVVKELARHTDFRLTLRYSHTTSQELQDAVNAIPNLLG